MPVLTRAPATVVRPIDDADIEPAAQIAFAAFAGIADRHGFPRDFPDVDAARAMVGGFASHPSIWGVVAEVGGRVVASNFLDERGPVRGVGPITVDPTAQAAGVGRLLMTAALERAAGASSVRLLQDSFNVGSLSLYASLGFDVVEQTVVVAGVPSGAPSPSVTVRRMTAADLVECERLCIAVHGFERSVELRDALDAPDMTPVVAVRDGRTVAYATTLTDFGLAHAVAESEGDMFELVLGAVSASGSPLSFLLPLHQHELVRRCLRAGLRVVKPMTYMVAGHYQRPNGAWIPSVLS